MKNSKKISFLMVTYNSFPFIKKSIEAIEKHLINLDYEIVVVDNNSMDETKDYLSTKENIIKVFLQKNSGFSAGMNTAFGFSSGEFVVVFNNDIYLEENSEEAMLDMINTIESDNSVGIISPLFKKEDGTYDINFNKEESILRSVYYRFYKIFSKESKTGELNRLEKNKNGLALVSAISGQFFLMRRDIFNLAGGFDTRYFLYTSDWDLCTKLDRMGFKNIIDTKIEFIHALSQSNSKKRFFSTYDLYRSFGKYIIKWKVFPMFLEGIYKILFFIPTALEILIRNLLNKKNVSD